MNTTKKIRLAILFGGRSAEHEISLQSAKNVAQAVDRDKYDIVLIGIDRTCRWLLIDNSRFLSDTDIVKLDNTNDNVALVAGEKTAQLINLSDGGSLGEIDVVFPVLHGPFGEDGTIQGLLKLANIPFVGAGVLGSAVGMDKDIMKRLLRDGNIPIGKYLAMHSHSRSAINFDDVRDQLGMPLFVKPANLGSSVGISKVDSKELFNEAIDLAFQYDCKIIVEEFIPGREIECAVLGNDDPIASVPGEIILRDDFYCYDTKYINQDGAALAIPAELTEPIVKEIQSLAIKTFKTLCCAGMARVDFFLKDTGQILVNEINTIPGFTKISMYPKLFQASGIPYTELIDRLIRLAIERFKKQKNLKTNPDAS